ncbi:unnamed protein product [Ostreobium quekettii]|uniref:Increased DNA methylation 1 C-terminal domain-containing protein n=1 Tax=Ostreobium quekettii TaxID=121088 RepID=A0A8S1J2F9_9CHLO|nr:unnamed protein product [Ostreobium quekettii]
MGGNGSADGCQSAPRSGSSSNTNGPSSRSGRSGEGGSRRGPCFASGGDTPSGGCAGPPSIDGNSCGGGGRSVNDNGSGGMGSLNNNNGSGGAGSLNTNSNSGADGSLNNNNGSGGARSLNNASRGGPPSLNDNNGGPSVDNNGSAGARSLNNNGSVAAGSLTNNGSAGAGSLNNNGFVPGDGASPPSADAPSGTPSKAGSPSDHRRAASDSNLPDMRAKSATSECPLDSGPDALRLGEYLDVPSLSDPLFPSPGASLDGLDIFAPNPDPDPDAFGPADPPQQPEPHGAVPCEPSQGLAPRAPTQPFRSAPQLKSEDLKVNDGAGVGGEMGGYRDGARCEVAPRGFGGGWDEGQFDAGGTSGSRGAFCPRPGGGVPQQPPWQGGLGAARSWREFGQGADGLGLGGVLRVSSQSSPPPGALGPSVPWGPRREERGDYPGRLQGLGTREEGGRSPDGELLVLGKAGQDPKSKSASECTTQTDSGMLAEPSAHDGDEEVESPVPPRVEPLQPVSNPPISIPPVHLQQHHRRNFPFGFGPAARLADPLVFGGLPPPPAPPGGPAPRAQGGSFRLWAVSERVEWDSRVRCAGCHMDYHFECLPGEPWGLDRPWFCSMPCHGISAMLAMQNCRGLVQVDRLVDNTPISWQLIRGAAVYKPSDCTAHAPKYTGQQQKRLRVVLEGAKLLLSYSFEPLLDGATEENLIPLMVEGRRSPDGATDFSGFQSATLWVGKTLVAVALLRVLGPFVAELPLVVVHREVRGYGLSKLLFSAVERCMFEVGVQAVVMPGFGASQGMGTSGRSSAELVRLLQKIRAHAKAQAPPSVCRLC